MRAARSPSHMILVGLWNFVTLTIALAIALGIAITGPPTRSEIAALETGMHRVIHRLDIVAQNLKKQICKHLSAETGGVEVCGQAEPRVAAAKTIDAGDDERGGSVGGRSARHPNR